MAAGWPEPLLVWEEQPGEGVGGDWYGQHGERPVGPRSQAERQAGVQAARQQRANQPEQRAGDPALG